MLGVVGGAVGLALAWGGLKLLVALGPESLPRLNEIGIDYTVLGFTFGVSVLAGLLFGLFPALRYGSPRLVTALKEGGRGGSAGKEQHLARNALVVAQMALALVLLAGSGLMIRSFQALRSVDPGFRDPGGGAHVPRDDSRRRRSRTRWWSRRRTRRSCAASRRSRAWPRRPSAPR